MTLDELSDSIRKISSDKVILRLSDELSKWKEDDSTIEQLRDRIERYIGNTWIESEEEHSIVYKIWSAFVKENIEPISGMTMNERLFTFSLIDRFDKAAAKDDKDIIYAKLLAKR